ncbi:MAG: hypothetical protein ABFS23_10635 [Pseudomonadota bacterium]
MSALIQPVRRGRLHVELAAWPDNIQASEALRYPVFVVELRDQASRFFVGCHPALGRQGVKP